MSRKVRDTGSDVIRLQDGVVNKNIDTSEHLAVGNKSEFVVLSMPKSSKSLSIDIFNTCVNGKCSCVYKLGDNYTQLKTCRFAALIFVNHSPTEKDWMVFELIPHGVDIIKKDIEGYECNNYDSILNQENKHMMDEIITNELSSGALSLVEDRPHCVHTLGAVPKPDGGIRPVTDCSHPKGMSINDHMDVNDLKFKYKSIDTVVDLINKGVFMRV